MDNSFADTEISSFEDDKLVRVSLARKVVERVVRSGGGPSTVFGLAGKWGSGKTSTLNFISRVIAEEHGERSNSPQKWSVVACTPWSSTDLEALTDEFYRAIAPRGRGDALARSAKLIQGLETGTVRLVEHLPSFEGQSTRWQTGQHQPDCIAAAVIAHDVLTHGGQMHAVNPLDIARRAREGRIPPPPAWMRRRIGS